MEEEQEFSEFSYEAMETTMGALADGFVVTDAVGGLLYMNQAAKDIFGCSFDVRDKERKNFKEICQFINLETKERFFCPIGRAIRENRNVGLSKNIGIMRGDTPVYLSATCSPRRTPEGKVIGCSAVFRDISMIHGLSRKVEADQFYMRSVFEAAKIGICTLNSNAAVVDVNESALETLGESYDGAIGKQPGEVFRCANSVPYGCGRGENCKFCIIRNNITAAIMDDSFSSEFVAALTTLRAEEPIWLQFFLTQVWKGNEKQIVLTLIDISRRKRREDELLAARRMAEAASNTKTQFLANMSHEIRTPINGMTGMINLTLRSPLTEEQRENLQAAKQCSEDLLRIINDILDYAKLENGKMAIEAIGIDLPQLLQRVVSVHGSVAVGKGLEFIAPAYDKLPRFIKGDPLRLRQILHNLLTNALKFTAHGSITLGARTVRRGIKELLELYVEDTGIGMTAQEQTKLFKPFSQVDGSTTRKFGGTGLGLMIVKELVNAMGGEIHVMSRPGQGSRFTITIPLELAECAETEIKDQTVFMNPYKDKDKDKEEAELPEEALSGFSDKKTVPDAPDDDIMDLLKYCEEKLNS